MPVDVKSLIQEGAELTDRALESLIPAADTVPASIHGAMRHSTFAGGKRLRPVLAMQAGVTIGGSLPKGIERLGAALEMLHTYSLIHDDLPALDNDDLRRGKPTCHVVFGEAIAILAGDALQTRAFEVLAGLDSPPAATVQIIRLISNAVGTIDGMIGGQVLDIESEGRKPTPELVEAIHRAKTGALIRVSVVAGGVYAGANADDAARLDRFGRKAGLAFQIVDDVLDMTVDSTQLGKTAGKDQATEKATWPAVYGIEQSRRDAAQLIEEAFAALEPYGSRADGLKSVARYLVERKS
ncbi:MAG TPA: farnesyl diphosphate synthase [Terracidiphilus sp.]|nr:farnesyl diphosphate synthase [Terracidiphilus sp.]